MLQGLKQPIDARRSLVLGLAAAIFVSVFVLLDYRRTITDAEERLAHVATLFNQTFDSSLALATEQKRHVVEAMSRAPFGPVGAFELRFGDDLRRLARQSPQIDALVVVEPAGSVVWSTTTDLIGADVSDRAYYQLARNMDPGEYALGTPISARTTGRKVTPIAWPVVDEAGVLRGVLASALDEDHFEALLTGSRFTPDMHVEVRSRFGPIAFTTRAEGEPEPRGIVQSEVAIKGSDLVTRVSLSRLRILQWFFVRTAIFVTLAGGLFALALTALAIARRRSAALVRSLAETRKEAEKARMAREQFLTIFRNVEDGIVVFDDAGSVATANRRARDLLGVALVDDAIAVIRRQEGPMAEADDTISTVILSQLPDGTYREIRCRINRVDGAQGLVHYCVLTDISAEERLASTRVRFVETVNHELRTPLTSLSGSLDLLSDRFGDDLAPPARKLVGLARRNANRLRLLVDDILTLQAVDQGGIAFDTETLSARAVVEEAVASLQGYADSFGITLEMDPATADGAFRADAMRMQQVLSNLISNAVKYSPRDQPVIVGARVNGVDSAGQGGDGGDTAPSVEFWCSDRGPGIPGAARRTVFDRFAKPAHGPEVQVTGTGLGLAISKELVERQGGRLVLETIHIDDPEGKTGHGTTFKVVFPQALGQIEDGQSVTA